MAARVAAAARRSVGVMPPRSTTRWRATPRRLAARNSRWSLRSVSRIGERPSASAVVTSSGGGETSDATGFNEGRHVIGPGRLVEVCRQEPTPLIGEQWVNANDVTPLEMVEDHLVLDREERLVWTLAALHPRLLADAVDPLVPTGGRVPLSPRPGVAPKPRVDILAASKARAEERDLFAGGRGRLQEGGSPQRDLRPVAL